MGEVVGRGGANTKRGQGGWIEARGEEGRAELGQEGVWRLTCPEIWTLGHQSVTEGS